MVSKGTTPGSTTGGIEFDDSGVGRCLTFLVRCGFDAEKLLDYPVDKIRLIAKYSREEAAADHLVLINGISLAIGSVVSKEVGGHFKRFMKALEKDAGMSDKPAVSQKPSGFLNQLIRTGQAKPM